ncbi:4-(cytidine 5'-diphospho)-2-C-methyl-D-erythritol kinase, partial [Rhodococcus hoagii]|nr:4-(cytidine 5'-diphospho)-2-C-methyl-D-erythritol kinase [Prescottella equi]
MTTEDLGLEPRGPGTSRSAPPQGDLSLRVGPPGADGYHPWPPCTWRQPARRTVTAIARTDGRITVGPSGRHISLVDTQDVP